MKPGFCVRRIAFVALAGLFLAGCLLKPTTVTTRHFLLAPISTNTPGLAGTDHLSVGIGLVSMPPYLLRSSMAVRNGANEIGFLQDAQWSERLDHCFQRTLAANLSQLLSTDSIYLTDWGADQVDAKVFVVVEQFDVDTRGGGTLIARWRIALRGSDIPVKSGRTRLTRAGTAPRGKPQAIASTLSELEAEFSRELAQSIRESVKSSP
jgi:uncharacterized lipoprotein YmbA